MDKSRPSLHDSILDIYYGNLIGELSMRNIHRRDTTDYDPGRIGMIGHRLLDSTVSYPTVLVIDPNTRTIEIAITCQQSFDGTMDKTVELKFKWNFHE